MDGSTVPEGSAVGGDSSKLDLLIRAGRGRTGGSTGLDLAVQRARYQGRRVEPLDGDLRSRTLSPTASLNLLDRRLACPAAAWASWQDMNQGACEADT